VSLIARAPHHFGIVIRQDPVTGALRTPVWAADEVTDVQDTVGGQVVSHAIQLGGQGPWDVRIRQPSQISVSFRISNALNLKHPRPDASGPDRAKRLAQELREIAEAGQPVALLVRGHDLLRNYVMESPTFTFAREVAEASIQVTFTHVRAVSLAFVPVEQDADLQALGSQLQASIGTLPG
jgi:hypothetical protein